MKSAKYLCAALITRSIQDLSEEEEEIIVDYLTDLGYDVDLDTKPRKLCEILLGDSMKKNIGKKIPISAYANSLIEKGKTTLVIQTTQNQLKDLQSKREENRKTLEKKEKNLPGCDLNNERLLSKNLYEIRLNPELGYNYENDSFSAVISINESQYTEIFLRLTNPIVDISTIKGERAFARIGESHNYDENVIYASQLVMDILGSTKNTEVFLKLCNSLPEITNINFTYYGNQSSLNEDLPFLIERLPVIINGYSYLSLGMLLYVRSETKEMTIRVEGLYSDERPIFAGIIPFGEQDIPFDIEPDI